MVCAGAELVLLKIHLGQPKSQSKVDDNTNLGEVENTIVDRPDTDVPAALVAVTKASPSRRPALSGRTPSLSIISFRCIYLVSQTIILLTSSHLIQESIQRM
jgi:hypothetical protein